MVVKGVPEHLRSDNGPEFVAKDLRNWLANTGAKTLYIEPGSPWENGYCESFNSKLRDEFLNGEIFYSIKELRVLAERWRVHYNTIRPHSSLGYRSPAPEAWLTNNTGHGEVETASRFPTPPNYLAMDLPHSDDCFVVAFPAETTEAFPEGHVRAFAYFGGVPTRILYDNTKIAVAKILGGEERQRTRAFSELQSYYLFADKFGRPRATTRARSRAWLAMHGGTSWFRFRAYRAGKN